MIYSKAFSPGHITGFFTIKDSSQNPLLKGSLGAGFSIKKGVTTSISLNESKDLNIKIIINNNLRTNAVVSLKVIKLFFEKTKTNLCGELTVDHSFEIPEGSGFGTSGGGALSLAICLNDLYKTKLSKTECAQLAHIAEVESKTGLGTVIGEFYGGYEIRTLEGAPGIGKIEKFNSDEDLIALFLVFGPYSTKSALKDENLRNRINREGKKLLELINKTPGIEIFLNCSYNFTSNTGLLPKNLEEICNKLREINIISSMLCFGEVIFTLVPENKKKDVLNIMNLYSNVGQIIESKIDFTGGRLL